MESATKPRLNVAVVGLGYWGPNRLRVLVDGGAVDVTWICDRDLNRARQQSSRAPAARVSGEIDEVLADPELDAVVLATPVFTHYALASQCLRAGKHVFVEKPIAATSGEASDLVELSEEVDRVLMCGHTFLYSPPVRRVKQILDAGELGELHFISSSRVNLGPYRSDVSVIFDLGPHDFSILRYWLDAMPERISAIGRDVISNGIADVAFVDLSFADGLLAHVELSWLAPGKLRRTVIVGSEKMLVYEDGSAEPVRIFDSGIEYEDPSTYGEYQLTYRTGDIVSVRVDAQEPIVAEMEDFVAAVHDGTEPVSHSEVALDVIRMVEAAELSMSNTGAPTAVPPQGAAATFAKSG